MKYFGITPFGAEEFFAKELENFGIKSELHSQIVIFETEKIEEVLYYSHIPKRICKFISTGKLSKITADFPKEKKTFGVRMKHPPAEDFDRLKLESEAGAVINKVSKMKVDLEDPDYWFTLFAFGKNYFLGLDVVHEELDKRPYKIFNNPQAVKGNIAASALIFAGYSGKQVILDTFCRSGEIAIEAALMASKISAWKYEPFDDYEIPSIKGVKPSIYCFDEIMANITATKKNAKLAGVDKMINFSKTDVSWLDTKLDENSVDLIITQPPVQTKQNKKAPKTIDEFFYQAEFILKAGGKIILISFKDETAFKSAGKYKFELVRKHIIMSGQQEYFLLEFGRK